MTLVLTSLFSFPAGLSTCRRWLYPLVKAVAFRTLCGDFHRNAMDCASNALVEYCLDSIPVTFGAFYSSSSHRGVPTFSGTKRKFCLSGSDLLSRTCLTASLVLLSYDKTRYPLILLTMKSFFSPLCNRSRPILSALYGCECRARIKYHGIFPTFPNLSDSRCSLYVFFTSVHAFVVPFLQFF